MWHYPSFKADYVRLKILDLEVSVLLEKLIKLIFYPTSYSSISLFLLTDASYLLINTLRGERREESREKRRERIKNKIIIKKEHGKDILQKKKGN